jgi:hypothetical protein
VGTPQHRRDCCLAHASHLGPYLWLLSLLLLLLLILKQ